MRLIMMRHGQSLGDEPFDADNQLTARGIEESLEAGSMLKSIQGLGKVDSIYTSPYKRTVETAELLDFGVRPIEVEEMTPSHSESIDTLDRLVTESQDETVIVVGHADFVSKIMNNKLDQKYISLRTGGYAVILVNDDKWDLLCMHRNQSILASNTADVPT